MKITEDDLGRLTEKVLMSALGLAVQRTPKTEALDQRISLTARVRISADDWSGALTLGCSELLAARVAVAAHATETDATPGRIEEAVGRVTDLIARGVKELIGSSCVLAPAIVCEATDVVPIGTRRVASVSFGCYSQPLLVTLAERQ